MIPATGDYRDQTSSGVEFKLVGNVGRNLTLRATFSCNSFINTRFFRPSRPFLAAAHAAARARSLDPDLATQVTQDFLTSRENHLAKNIYRTVNLAGRYSFAPGARVRPCAARPRPRHYHARFHRGEPLRQLPTPHRQPELELPARREERIQRRHRIRQRLYVYPLQGAPKLNLNVHGGILIERSIRRRKVRFSLKPRILRIRQNTR